MPIRFDVVQGTSEWAALRLGIPTASQFGRIMTPKTMKFSDQAEGYARELLAEQLLGVPMDSATSGFMERGTLLEKKAVDYYELQRDCTVDRVGFVTTDDGRVGCSPDGFVDDRGMIEIKVPSAAVHIGYLLGEAVADKYRCQVQGSLLICERDWIDTEAYNPQLPTPIVRQHRDEAFIAKLDASIKQFLDYMDESKHKLQQYGLFPGFGVPDLKIA